MASAEPPITHLHTFGFHQEVVLQPVLEAYVGEAIKKTAKRFDTIDFEGPTCCVELKCRSAYNKRGGVFTSTTHNTWLVPASKIDYAEHHKKKFYIFYWFAGDQTLWVIDYEKGLFKHLNVEYPEWHERKQPHYYVPADMWTRIEIVEESE